MEVLSNFDLTASTKFLGLNSSFREGLFLPQIKTVAFSKEKISTYLTFHSYKIRSAWKVSACMGVLISLYKYLWQFSFNLPIE